MILEAVLIAAQAMAQKSVVIAAVKPSVLADAPKPKVLDRKFIVAMSILGASAAADYATTSRAISDGRPEANPLFGSHPSDARIALTGAAFFAAEVSVAYALKRFGRGHKWARHLWIIEPSWQTVGHAILANRNIWEPKFTVTSNP